LTGSLSLLTLPERRSGEGAQQRPLLVELLGPAGAGKTAVLRALGQRDENLRLGLRIDRVRFLPMMIRHAIGLAPTAFELMRRSPWSWRPAMLHLVRLRSLPGVLSRETTPTYRAIVLDEGPLFSLSRLSVFHDANSGSGRLALGWRAALDYWAGALDAVIWLDAPNPILWQRIRQRFKDHQIKDKSERAAFEFLDRYRDAYREVLAKLTSVGRVRLLWIDTATESIDQATARVLETLGQMGHPRRAARDRSASGTPCGTE
jgi:shikimate kinase